MAKRGPKREKKSKRERERQEIERGKKYFEKVTERDEDDRERPKKRNKIETDRQEIERGRKYFKKTEREKSKIQNEMKGWRE